VVVAPDAGFAKRARRYARRLNAPLAIADKVRSGHDEEAEVVEIIGDVADRDAVVVDDFTVSGGTLVEAAEELVARGARSVTVAITHGVFVPGCLERIEDSPIERLIVTDTIESEQEPLAEKVTVVSVAPLFAEAIRRIHLRESISVLFPS
jgi:ribose-phosphate pyrophosphokinase